MEEERPSGGFGPRVAFVFVVDTSASMNAVGPHGLSALDVAKSAVEHFIRCRERSPRAAGDRYLLATCGGVRAGWGACGAAGDEARMEAFLDEVKNLEASALGGMPRAVADALALLNRYRMAGADSFGRGRAASLAEPGVVVALSDGERCAFDGPGDAPFAMPAPSDHPGREFASDPFRWDQRVYGVSLGRMYGGGGDAAGKGGGARAFADFCEATGGRVHAPADVRQVRGAMQLMADSIGPALVWRFRARGGGGVGPAAEASCALLALGPESAANHWPVPEAYRARVVAPPPPPPASSQQDDGRGGKRRKKRKRARKNAPPPPPPPLPPPSAAAAALPLRPAQPLVLYERAAGDGDDVWPLPFPFDRYEVGDGPFAQRLLHEAGPAGATWNVFMPGSDGPGEGGAADGRPFGILHASASGLWLYVLPYDYAALRDVMQQQQQAPPDAWAARLRQYVASVPPYYEAPLRAYLHARGVRRQDLDRPRAAVDARVEEALRAARAEAMRLDAEDRQGGGTRSAAPRGDLFDPSAGAWRVRPSRVRELPLPRTVAELSLVPRERLLETVERMRRRVLAEEKLAADGGGRGGPARPQQEAHDRFSLPVARMGDYASVIRARAELRDPLAEDGEASRAPTFGSPFRRRPPSSPSPPPAAAKKGEQDDEALARRDGGRQKRRRPRSPFPLLVVEEAGPSSAGQGRAAPAAAAADPRRLPPRRRAELYRRFAAENRVALLRREWCQMLRLQRPARLERGWRRRLAALTGHASLRAGLLRRLRNEARAYQWWAAAAELEALAKT